MKSIRFTYHQILPALGYLILKVIHLFYPLSFVSSYLDDLFFLYLLLSVALFVQRVFIVHSNDFIFSKPIIVAVWIYTSIVFEWVAPHYQKAFTSDVIDVIFYGLGAWYFYAFINVKQTQPYPTLLPKQK